MAQPILPHFYPKIIASAMGACLLREKNDFFCFLSFAWVIEHCESCLKDLYYLLSGKDVFFVVAISLLACFFFN